MPHTKSALKRHRQNEKRRLRNRHIRSDLRSQIKKFLKCVHDGNAETASAELRVVYKKLDKCAMRRYLHPNTAKRYKSRLTVRLNALQQSQAASV